MFGGRGKVGEVIIYFFLTNSMCYHILLNKVPGQGQKQKQKVQDSYTLSHINLT
jgi:hypothetical protein